MTKELAMQILGLEKEFTFKELMEAYHRKKINMKIIFTLIKRNIHQN